MLLTSSSSSSSPSSPVFTTPSIVWLLSSLLVLWSKDTSFSTTAASFGSVNYSKRPKFPLPGVIPDPFVAVAPLIIGVVCQDSVLLLALHTTFATTDQLHNKDDYGDESILLFADGDLTERRQTVDLPPVESNGDAITTTITTKLDYPFTDLPPSYRGPFRIYPIDAAGTTALLCAGWRTDGQRLAEYLQSIDREEVELYGSSDYNGVGSDDDDDDDDGINGFYLANKASLVMAALTLSGGNRPWSTVGLLASCSQKGRGGALWLVDVTGAYRVRAHAVGGATLAGSINDYLRRQDWTKRKCVDVAKELLRTMFEELEAENDPSDAGNRTKFEVPRGSLVEMMAVGMKGEKGRRRLTRLYSSTLFGCKEKPSM
jgi:20S proteasome alpha/beta subunit